MPDVIIEILKWNVIVYSSVDFWNRPYFWIGPPSHWKGILWINQKLFGFSTWIYFDTFFWKCIQLNLSLSTICFCWSCINRWFEQSEPEAYWTSSYSMTTKPQKPRMIKVHLYKKTLTESNDGSNVHSSTVKWWFWSQLNINRYISWMCSTFMLYLIQFV